MAEPRAVRFEPAVSRVAYAEAGAALLDVAGRVPGDGWDAPGLGEWSVRDLVGHTGRAFLTVTQYLDTGAGRSIELDHPFDYARLLRLAHADPAAVTERGRQAGRDLGPDPLAALTRQHADAVAAVAAHPDDAPVASPAGVMRLADYLPTRVLELVVHTDDLARALGVEHEPPAPARVVATCFAAGLGAEERTDAVLLRALTGRAGLDAGFTVL